MVRSVVPSAWCTTRSVLVLVRPFTMRVVVDTETDCAPARSLLLFVVLVVVVLEDEKEVVKEEEWLGGG